jgi:hypothetical protein
LLSIFFACGCYSMVNGYEDVEGYDLSMFSKVGKTFITSLHLNSKELDLDSELLLSSSDTFWGLLSFGLSV